METSKDRNTLRWRMNHKELTLFLNRVLSNYFVLYVKLHRYSWFAEGEHIFQLQNLYKEMYHEIKNDIDMIANHILSINGIPYATMIKFIKEATIEEATADDKEEEMMEQLLEDVSHIIIELNDIGLKGANELNDHLSKDLLIHLLKKLTHYRWRLQGFFGR